MKAVILLGTLKKEELSNTETLSEFFADYLKKEKIEVEIIKLVNQNILAGTYTNMGEGDAWPGILEKLIAAEIIIFATPVWWGSHSSEIQKVIERLDHIHDGILQTGKSGLDGKIGGIIITGDSDGGEQIIGIISNFLNAIGILLPPYATITVLSQQQAKDKKPAKEELIQLYKKEYAKNAEKMLKQIMKFAGKEMV